MSPNPTRSLPSHAVLLNVPACVNLKREHHMVSVQLGEATSIGYVEICSRCNWIDEASLQWWVEDAIKQNMSKRAQRIAVAVESQPFQFVQSAGEPLTLEEILFQALGAASTCWVGGTGELEFDSSRAKEIGEALLREVNRAMTLAQQNGPVMELAYELYSLACNSKAWDDLQQVQWQAAFERLKARFHELAPEGVLLPEPVG